MIGSLLALAAAALQPTPSAPLAGIWEGTIGDLPVRACFAERDGGEWGAYYYLSRLQLIGLEPEEGRSGAFHESIETRGSLPGWRIARADAASLTGQWTGGGRTLPLRLRRAAQAGGAESPCASLAFHRPRLDGVRTIRSRATVDGTAYTKLTLDTADHFGVSVETFALDGDGDAVRRINEAVGESLAGDPPRWLQCVTDSLDQGSFEGTSEESLAPVMILRRWLSVAANADWSCGGAHPDASRTYRLFDRTNGAEVDPLDWFGERAVKRETFEGSSDVAKTLEPDFLGFVLAGWQPAADAAECGEVVRGQQFWSVGLTREGFVFTPLLPHVVQACGEEFRLSFDRARPWLTPEGAANVELLRAERPAA